MILLPIAGAVSLAFTSLFEKLGLRVKNIDSDHFIAAVLVVALVVMLPFMFFFGQVNSAIFETRYLLLFAGTIIAGTTANILYYRALKWEKLSNLEPVQLLQPLFIVAIAFIVFPSERDLGIIIPTLIAGSALIFSHIKKHHLDFNKFILLALFASLLGAVENNIIKELLDVFTPLSMYFFRGLFIAFFLFLVFRPHIFKEIRGSERWIVVATAVLWVGYRILSFYGYMQLGLVFTTLIFMIAPVIVYLLAWKVLKEKPDWRNLTAAAIIVACVVYVIL